MFPDAAQDVGRAINPMGVEGQIEGGTAMGLGLAVMEEIRLADGRITNASFTDYLIPTILDVPPMRSAVVEDPEPGVPYGVKGIGESSTIVATAAIVAAIRNATGLELNRAPWGRTTSWASAARWARGRVGLPIHPNHGSDRPPRWPVSGWASRS